MLIQRWAWPALGTDSSQNPLLSRLLLGGFLSHPIILLYQSNNGKVAYDMRTVTYHHHQPLPGKRTSTLCFQLLPPIPCTVIQPYYLDLYTTYSQAIPP